MSMCRPDDFPPYPDRKVPARPGSTAGRVSDLDKRPGGVVQ